MHFSVSKLTLFSSNNLFGENVCCCILLFRFNIPWAEIIIEVHQNASGYIKHISNICQKMSQTHKKHKKQIKHLWKTTKFGRKKKRLRHTFPLVFDVKTKKCHKMHLNQRNLDLSPWFCIIFTNNSILMFLSK